MYKVLFVCFSLFLALMTKISDYFDISPSVSAQNELLYFIKSGI